MRTGVIIGTDQRLLRDGLCRLLGDQPELNVVGEAANGQEVVALARELQPRLVLLSSHLPRLNAVDATQRIKSDAPSARIILLDAEPDWPHVRTGLNAGACGFLPRESSYEELLQCIDTVLEDQPYLSPRVTSVVVDEVRRAPSGEVETVFSALTAREREVLQLIAEGLNTKEVAAQLGVSTKTVEWYRAQLMRKLDCHSIATLTRYAIREGLVPLDG